GKYNGLMNVRHTPAFCWPAERHPSPEGTQTHAAKNPLYQAGTIQFNHEWTRRNTNEKPSLGSGHQLVA
ncbi:MAG TPA: hypothetical protein VIM71_00110, partial [Lacunisphaera sp.]